MKRPGRDADAGSQCRCTTEKKAVTVPEARAAIIAKALASGASKKGALKAAGYGESTAAHRATEICNSEAVRKSLSEAFQQAGVTSECVAGVLKDALEAVRWQTSRHQGKVSITEVGPDHQTRLRAVELVLQILAGWRKQHLDGGGTPRLVINVNPVFAQAMFGNGTHHGDSDRYRGGESVAGQTRPPE